jgi:HlyD family secretion protein
MNEQIPPPQAKRDAAAVAPFAASRPVRGQRAARLFWLLGGLAAFAVIAGVATWWTLETRTSVHYITAQVTRGAITRNVTATGTVNPELTIIVGTYVSGVIQDLTCDYNTEVKKGQVCARIDPRPYQTVVDQNKANLAVAKAQLEKDKASLTYAQHAFDRAAKLVQTSAVSQDAYDNAKSAFEQAQAQILFDEATIQQRQASLDAAQVNLDYTNIVSPVDGTVVSRNVTMGQTVAASFQTPTLFLIATDLTRMQVDTNVSESDIGDIKVGDKANFTVDAFPKSIFQGTVSQVRQSPQTVQNVVTYDVVISLDNSDLSLKPGMTAATRVVVDQRDAVMRVPNAALRYRSGLAQNGQPDQARIWILRDGEPVSLAVVAGLDDDNFTEIVSGDVKPGDQVITGEQTTARNGAAAPRLRF